MARRSVIGRMIGSANASSGWDMMAPADILARPAGDLRPPVAEHVVTMAETIAAIGLLHPVVVDCQRRLLAGRHRVEAFRLLAITSPDERRSLVLEQAGLDPAATSLSPRISDLVERSNALDLEAFRAHHPDALVPVRIRTDLDAEADPAAAQKAEIAENDVRRDFTRPEILAYTDLLRAAGYDDTPGRPKAGTKALIPALVGIVGKSRRTILRVLAEQRAETPKPADPAELARTELRAALSRFQRRCPSEALTPELQGAIELLQQELGGG
ncbi:MAG: hypothetical protein PF961_06610 [Planctomycetota bacterium]|jgi:ParB-like chromosome segregation protein Spo0J|nr:hypothetical protein [Planctomycetota bacterium]